jgi:hypothetical protein
MSERQLDEFASTKRRGKPPARREVAILDAEVARAKKILGAEEVALAIAAARARCRRRRRRR